MKNSILIVLFFFVQVFAVLQWVSCTNFSDQFHFSSFDLKLRLIEGIHNDTGVPLHEVRLFHNKLIGFVFDLFGQYLQFWNILFLVSLISLSGVVGLGAGFYYFFTKKKSKLLWLLFGALLIAPFVEIFGFTKLPYLLRLGLIAGMLLVWSLFGYWYVFKEKKVLVWLLVGLFLVSLWYQLSTPIVGKFCLV